MNLTVSVGWRALLGGFVLLGLAGCVSQEDRDAADLRTLPPAAIMPGGEVSTVPLHDWKDERGWDGVHLLWLRELVRWLRPRLPADFRAYVGSVPALTVESPNGRPDLQVRRWQPEQPAP